MAKKDKRPGLKYIKKMPAALLYHPGLRLPEKVFLGMVASFDKGLKISNAEIGKILCLHPGNVSAMISELAAGGWIEIKAKQSRWRRIYLSAGAKVSGVFTLAQKDDTLALARFYFSAGAKQNRNNFKEEGNSPFSRADKESPPDPKPAPDPEQLARVMADLGFEGGGL